MSTIPKDVFEAPDPAVEYRCSRIVSSSGFTLLMKWVMLTSEYPELNDHIAELLKRDPEAVNQTNTEKWTPLMLAFRNLSTNSSIETVKLLIDNGANINMVNSAGWTALMLVSRYCPTDDSLELAKLLLENRADPNIVDINGWSALMHASRYSSTDSSAKMVKLLLENGANVNVTNNDGWTILMLTSLYLSTESSIEALHLLLENGADVTAKNKKGYTALMTVSERCEHPELAIRALLAYGADPCDWNFDGKFALSIMCEKNLELSKVMIDYCNVDENLLYRVSQIFTGERLFKYTLNIFTQKQMLKVKMKECGSKLSLRRDSITLSEGQLGSSIIIYRLEMNGREETGYFEYMQGSTDGNRVLDYLGINMPEKLRYLNDFLEK